MISSNMDVYIKGGRTVKNNECVCKEGVSCAICSVSGGSDLGNLTGAMTNLLGRINTLTSEVLNLSGLVIGQNSKIQKLEGGKKVCRESGSESITSKRRSRKMGIQIKSNPKGRSSEGLSSHHEDESATENVKNSSVLRKRKKPKQKQKNLTEE